MNKPFKIKFDLNEIKKLQNKRLEGVYQNGCFSQELRKEKYGY